MSRNLLMSRSVTEVVSGTTENAQTFEVNQDIGMGQCTLPALEIRSKRYVHPPQNDNLSS